MSNILKEADAIVNRRSQEKQRMYGPFSESMERTAAMYNLMVPEEKAIEAEDIFKVLIALKLSREAFAHKEDNLLDAVAYIGALNNFLED